MTVYVRRALWAVPLFLVACASNAQQPSRPQGPSDVVATVGNVSITLADVDQKAMQTPANEFGTTKLVLAIYEARRNAIEEIASEKLIDMEAKTRGVPGTSLIDSEITSKIQQVTDADIVAWYNANQSRVQGASLEQVRATIRHLMIQQRTAIAYMSFVVRLTLKT